MTANIDPLKSAPTGPGEAAPKPQAPAHQPSGTFAAALRSAERTTAASDIPPSPPPELAERIAAAARAWSALAAEGRYISFTDSPEGGTRIELTADDGRDATQLTASDLFALIDREGAA